MINVIIKTERNTKQFGGHHDDNNIYQLSAGH